MGPAAARSVTMIVAVLLGLVVVRRCLNRKPRAQWLCAGSLAAAAAVALAAVLWAHPIPLWLPTVAHAQRKPAQQLASPSPTPSLARPTSPLQPIIAVRAQPSPSPAVTPTIPSPQPVAVLRGKLLERSFFSAALGKDMPYIIYLPPNYDTAMRRFPTLYMLHGRGGGRGDWIAAGLADAADRGIVAGRIVPMLIVFPEGLLGYWTNHSGDGPRWGDYVDRDLVSHVDSTYATLRQPSARAIGGVSMGGWGALHHGFTHPEVFGIVGAHSPALRPDDGTLAFLGSGSEFASKDPMSLAGALPASVSLQIWIDTGVDDPWAGRATLLHGILAERGIAHTWQLNLGGHTWDYWCSHVEDYVEFYSQAFVHALSGAASSAP